MQIQSVIANRMAEFIGSVQAQAPDECIYAYLDLRTVVITISTSALAKLKPLCATVDAIAEEMGLKKKHLNILGSSWRTADTGLYSKECAFVLPWSVILNLLGEDAHLTVEMKTEFLYSFFVTEVPHLGRASSATSRQEILMLDPGDDSPEHAILVSVAGDNRGHMQQLVKKIVAFAAKCGAQPLYGNDWVWSRSVAVYPPLDCERVFYFPQNTVARIDLHKLVGTD